MKAQIDITDDMIAKSVDKVVRVKLDNYFGKDAWAQYGNYNKMLDCIVTKRVNESITDEKILEIMDEKKDYIAELVAENITARIVQSMSND